MQLYSTCIRTKKWTNVVLKYTHIMHVWNFELCMQFAFWTIWKVICKKDQVYYIQYEVKSSFLQITSHLCNGQELSTYNYTHCNSIWATWGRGSFFFFFFCRSYHTYHTLFITLQVQSWFIILVQHTILIAIGSPKEVVLIVVLLPSEFWDPVFVIRYQSHASGTWLWLADSSC